MPDRSVYTGLRELAARRPLVLDAPAGAELVRRGVRWRKNGLQGDADAVRAVHVDYLRAGADLLRTNTFGMNHRTYLNVFRDPEHMARIGAPGLATLAPRLLRRGVELAREARDAAGRPEVPVAAVISPLEHVFRPDLAPPDAEAGPEHAEIAKALAEAGPDLLLIEAMGTLREPRSALAAARGTGLPIWVSLAVDSDGQLLGGESIAEARKVASQHGAEAIIVTAAPSEDTRRALAALGPANGALVGAVPMCGRFDPPSWKFEFHPRFGELPGPEAFADEIAGLAAGGARIVGGWCGATPEHVAAISRRVGGA